LSSVLNAIKQTPDVRWRSCSLMGDRHIKAALPGTG
jgi:hypothetical protein